MRGFSLAQVLMVGALALIAAFSLAAITTSHLNLATRSCNRAEALMLAEAAVHETIGRIRAQPTYGQARESVRIENGDRWALVSFDPANGQVDTSRNDIQPDGSAGTAHLVARASVRGVQREVEVLVTIPPYLYTVATSGPLVSNDGLEVRELTTGTGSHIASNTGISAAGTFVASGDVISPSIALPPDAVVLGREIRDAPPVELPKLNLDEWNPRLVDELSSWSTKIDPVVGDAWIQGASYTRADQNAGNLTVNGNLRLDKGLLFVEGDLTVRGKVYGRGALVVKGRTTIQGTVDVTAVDDTGSAVALLTAGDTTVAGQGGPNRFQGLIYTEKSFSGRNVQVIGAFAQAAGAGDVSLNRVVFESDPGATQMTVQVQAGGPMVRLFEGGRPPRTPLPIEMETYPTVVKNLSLATVPAMNQVVMSTFAGKPFGAFPFIPEQSTGVSPSICRVELPDWETRLPGLIQKRQTQLDLRYHRGRPLWLVAQVVPQEAETANGGFDPARYHLEVQNGRYIVSTSTARVHYFLVEPPVNGLYPSGTNGAGAVMHLPLADAHRVMQAYTGVADRDADIIATSLRAQQALADQANQAMDAAGAPTGDRSWSREIDLNRFLQDTMPLRIVSWRER